VEKSGYVLLNIAHIISRTNSTQNTTIVQSLSRFTSVRRWSPKQDVSINWLWTP